MPPRPDSAQLDLGCSLQHGAFELTGSNLHISTPDESLIFFVLRLIERLRAMGTAPAADWMQYCPLAALIPHRTATVIERHALSYFDNALARIYGCFQPRPNVLEGSRQSGCPAIANTNLKEAELRPWLAGEIEEILILGNEHAVLSSGVTADLSVRLLGHSDFEDMFAIETLLAEENRKRGRQLVIDQELHDTCSTM